MASELKKGPRGLPSIAAARERRSRRGARWTGQAGLVAAGAVLAAFVLNALVTRRELSSGKQALLAKQHAVERTLGAQWFPLRDRIERDVQTAAQSYAGDRVDLQARSGHFRSQPGLYLRMRLADARGPSRLGQAAANAKKDAFAACLLREPNERGLKGDIDGGAFAEQPWNLGKAYAATRILTQEWVSAVTDADEVIRLRVFSEQYDKAVGQEIPLAVDIVNRAQFFLLVLDEDTPEAAAFTDGGPMTEEALQLVGHPAQVHLFDLKEDREILRLRRSGDARVIPAGERRVSDSETLAAMQRQANNCALAGLVEAALRQP
jgi:hypothetical protein